jgi:heat shock protein 4
LGVRKNAKGRLRLLEAIEKARKILSANSEAPVHVEYLVEDEDFSTLIKREEYEILIQPFLANL